MAQATYIARKGEDADFAALTCDSLVVSGAITAGGGVAYGDDDLLAFGASTDVTMEWDTAATPDQFQIAAAADDSIFSIGVSATSQKSFDLKWFANEDSGASYLYGDASANLLYTTGVDFQFKDSDYLVFGTGSGATGDLQMAWDGTDFDVMPTADDSVFNFGNGTLNWDVYLYAQTASTFVMWDASYDTLEFTDNAWLGFGNASTAPDVLVYWDATNLLIVPHDDDLLIEIADSGASQKSFDIKWYANENNGASYLYADASANLIYTTGIDLQFVDSDMLVFGTGAGAAGDVQLRWDGTDLDLLPTADDSVFKIGDGTLSFDVWIYGGAAADYLAWDASASKLSGVGAATLQVGESTTGVSTAGGTSMIYGYAAHKTNALTGTLRGVRGNAAVLVASVDGVAEGVFGRAANGLSTSATDGVNLDTARGVSALVAGVGLAAGGPAILEKAYGVYAQLDIDAANLTVSDARGLYVNVQSGSDTSNTLSACNLAYLEFESVVGTAPAINSAIRIAQVGGVTGATSLIDATGFTLAVSDTDKVTLIKFKDASGAAKALVYDQGDGALSVV